jgi:hypothetical protein
MGNRCLLPLIPDYPSFKFLFRAQCVEFFKKGNGEGGITRTARTGYNAGKGMFKSEPLVYD